MNLLLIGLLLITLISCGEESEKPAKSELDLSNDSTHQKINSMADYEPNFEQAHPTARLLMKDEFYWSPIEETAPFGSDDGSDTYAGFATWRKVHPNGNPKDYLTDQICNWGYPTFDLNESNLEKLKPYLRQSDLGSRYMSGIDAAIVAIAFGQLYLEGTVESDFKELAKTSLKRELIPELLNLWGEDYKEIREIQLNKMLTVMELLE